MNKIIKNISRVLFSLLLIVSIFGAFSVYAADVIFQITGISVKEKSDKVTVNDVSLSGGSINNDIVFTDQGDYITYDITIKNVTEDDYTIKSITDDNTSAYLEYTYDDLSNVKVNKGESKTFELTITYKQETSDLTITDKAVSLTLTYEKEDGTTGTETITNDDNNGTTTTDDTNTTGEVKGEQTITNPKTGDNITIYIILGLVSLTGLVITTVSKKHLQKSLMAVALVSSIAIPLGVKADSNKYLVAFSTNKIENSYSELVTGPEFNLAMNQVSMNDYSLRLDNYWYYDDFEDLNWFEIVDSDNYGIWNDLLLSIKPATDNQFNDIKESLDENNIISNENSNVPTYIWFDEADGTLYYYSFAKKIYLNEDSSLMFYGSGDLSEVDFSGFDTSKVKNMAGMFAFAYFSSFDLDTFDTRNVENMSYMFLGIDNTTSLDLNSFNTSKVTNMRNMFSSTTLTSLDLTSFDTSNVTDMSSMFADNDDLAELNLSGLDARKVKDMEYMFGYCSSLTSINFNSFKTRDLENAYQMFYYTGLVTLDLSSFDTSNVKNMSEMFLGSKDLTEVNLSSFDTGNVTDMSGMFNMCDSLTELDVSSFNTENVEDMNNMFNYCRSLQELNVSNFDTSKVKNMHAMFAGVYNITSLDLSNFNTENVTDMSNMFYMYSPDYSSVLKELDLSSFNTRNVENMNVMFNDAEELETVYVSNNFVTDKVTNSENMFERCYSIVGGEGTTYNASKIDHTYAHIDGGTSNPGYFKLKQN